MPRQARVALGRGAALLVAAALVSACSERDRPAAPAGASAASTVAAPVAPAAPSAPPAATASSRTLLALLVGAEVQAETDAQRDELRRALRDLRDKPLAALRDVRYAGAGGQPNERDLVKVLGSHLVPEKPVSYELGDLVEGRDTPEGRAAIDALLASMGTGR